MAGNAVAAVSWGPGRIDLFDIAPDRRLPGVGLVYRFNDVLGESLIGMTLARLASKYDAPGLRLRL